MICIFEPHQIGISEICIILTVVSPLRCKTNVLNSKYCEYITSTLKCILGNNIHKKIIEHVWNLCNYIVSFCSQSLVRKKWHLRNVQLGSDKYTRIQECKVEHHIFLISHILPVIDNSMVHQLANKIHSLF